MFFYAAKRLLRESSSAGAESIRNGYYGRLYLIGFVMDCRNQRFSCQVSLCTTHSVLYMRVCLDGLFSGSKWLWISSSHVMKWCGVVHLQIKDVQQEFLKHCPKGHDTPCNWCNFRSRNFYVQPCWDNVACGLIY